MAMSACVRETRHLVDLVHHSERTAVELLQGHEVKHRGDAALPSTLMVGRQFVELSAAVKLHSNSYPIFVILFLQWIDRSNIRSIHRRSMIVSHLNVTFLFLFLQITTKGHILTSYDTNHFLYLYSTLHSLDITAAVLERRAIKTKWKSYTMNKKPLLETTFQVFPVFTSFSECRSTSPAHCIEQKKSLNLLFICSTSCFRGFSQRSLACDAHRSY